MVASGSKRFATTAAILLVATVLCVRPTAASAHDLTKTDGNDTGGPLDLASIRVQHTGTGLRYTFRTFSPFKARALSGASYLLIAIDQDRDGTADRCAFEYFYASALRGALTRCGRQAGTVVPVTKPSKTTATITIPSTSIAGTHEWAAFSYYEGPKPCRKGCADSVPNLKPLLHDLTPPTPTWITTTTTPFFSTQLSTSTIVPVSFELFDADTNVATWEIGRSMGPAGPWDTIATGSGDGPTGTDLSLEEGQSYTLRISATDAQGNVGTDLDYLRLAVPFDDGNPSLHYAGSWAPTSNVSYFENGYHATSGAGDTMSITISNTSLTYVYLLGGPSTGAAMWSDGAAGNSVEETPSTGVGQWVSGFTYGTPGTHTFTLTVTSGTFIVDGIAVVTL